MPRPAQREGSAGIREGRQEGQPPVQVEAGLYRHVTPTLITNTAEPGPSGILRGGVKNSTDSCKVHMEE